MSTDLERPFTVEQYRAAVAEQARLKSEKDEAQRQEHMARAAEERLRSAIGEARRLLAHGDDVAADKVLWEVLRDA